MNIVLSEDNPRVLLIRLGSDVAQQVGFPRAIRPSFTLKYMESLLKKADYPTKFIDGFLTPLTTPALLESTLAWNPDFVVVLGTSNEYEKLLSFSELLSLSKNITIIAVGQDVTARPEEYIFIDSPIDIILLGESEINLLKFLEKFKTERDLAKLKQEYAVDITSLAPAIVSDLDNLPFPSYRKIELRKYIFPYPIRLNKILRWGHILSSRGCPYECIFCSQTIRESYGTQIRLRSAENVVDEIEYLKLQGANVISFDDDAFTNSRTHVFAVCEEMKRRKGKIPWLVHAKVDDLDVDLMREMKDAGCLLLRLGIESGSERIVNILKKTDKDNWIEKSKEVIAKAKELDMAVATLFLVGNPSETEEEIKKTIALAKELNPDVLQVSYFTPYPGSFAYKEFQNIIKKEDVSRLYHYREPVLNVSRVDSLKLKALYKDFYREFLLRFSFFIEHIRRYIGFYFFNPKVLWRLLKIISYLNKK